MNNIVTIKGIKCDNESCDFIDKEVPFEDYPKWELLPIRKWVVLLIEIIKDWDILIMKSEKRSNPHETTIKA